MMRNRAIDTEIDGAGYRRPPNHRGKGASGAANHDIVGSPALQPHCVDYDVEHDREGQEGSRNDIYKEAKRQDRSKCQSQTKPQCFAGQNGTTWDRPLRSSLHEGIDIRIEPHVQGARRAGANGNGQKCHRGNPGMDDARRRDKSDQRSENDKRHHARLQEREVVFNASLSTFAANLVVSRFCANVTHSGFASAT